MATVYRIHPAIGVARVGNHETAFFIGPEGPGSPGVEIDADGAERPLAGYKSGGKVKRQAARFRVFAYDQDASGDMRLIGEVGSEAHVEWSVDLVNRKAAFAGELGPAGPRNTDIADRSRLVIRGLRLGTVAGPGQKPEVVRGKFLGEEVYLGEILTDDAGHLLVLGGRGESGSVPPGVEITQFANNDRWYDDVSDGPVSATVTLPGQDPVVVHDPAWVVVAPPDFAPGIDAAVTLYDVAYQAAIDKGAAQPAARPSFTRHIRPLIERTLALRWVDDDWDRYAQALPVDWNTLADPSPAARVARQVMRGRVESPGLSMFGLPAFIKTYLKQWSDGDFDSDLGTQPPAEPLPQQLDRAALGHGSGNNFFPGIEAGQNLKDPNVYTRPFRLDRTNAALVYPGCLTEIMALPWQADFYACDGGVWWPTQRPDMAVTDPHAVPGSKRQWEDPINGYESMVDHVLQLGFVVPQEAGGEIVFVEVERDPHFARGVQ
jgi:hypothetical protein